MSFVTNNKFFWKKIKPFLSNKGSFGSQIKLDKKNEVLQDNDLIPKELNELFKNAASTLNIKKTDSSRQGHQTVLLILQIKLSRNVSFTQVFF